MSSTAASSSSTPTGSSTLNQADYLKLLVTQMTEQDPLNPQSDTAFAAQLAQFSSLQETQTMSGNIQSLQATALIGKTVSVTDNSNANQIDTGVVSGVNITGGTPSLLVNGQLYALSQLSLVAPTTTTTTSATSASSTGN